MEFHQASSATFSKKLSGKHAYGGVFGGSGKLASSRAVEDYKEIFGGCGASSIPVLEVPELNEAEVSVDARSSRLDYSKIFGGFSEADFAVSYEQLLERPNKEKKTSSQEPRDPAEPRPQPAVSENVTEQRQLLSPEAFFRSFDGPKQFNMSYNKISLGSKNGTNGMTHITQLNARLINDVTPLKMTDSTKPVRPVLNDAHLNINVQDGLKEDKPLKKAVLGPQPRTAAENISRSQAEFQKKSGRNISFSNDIFDAFEIGLGAHPPRMPTPSRQQGNIGSKSDSGRFTNLKMGVSQFDVSEGTLGDYSPPYFDEEVDANSAAAASAAAVRKAIQEAQAQIQIAKEIMERKKEGVQHRVKPGFYNGPKAERRQNKTLGNANKSKENCPEIHENEDSSEQIDAHSSEQKATTANQVTPIITRGEKVSYIDKIPTQSAECKSSQPDNRLEEAEDVKASKQFPELTDNGEFKETVLQFKQADNTKEMMPSANKNVWREEMSAEVNIKKPEEYAQNLKAFEEVSKLGKVEREVNFEEGIFKWDKYFKFISSVQELHHVEESGEKFVTEMKEDQKLDKNARLEIQEPEENKDAEQVQEAQAMVENAEEERETCNQELAECRPHEVLVGKVNNRQEIQRLKENGSGHKESLEMVECEKRQEEDWKQEMDEMKQNDFHLREDTEKKSAEVYEEIDLRLNDLQDKEDDEDGQQTTEEAETYEDMEETTENEKKLEEDIQMNETEKRQGKSCCGVGMESIEEVYQNGEEYKNMVQIHEALKYQENGLGTADDLCNQDKKQNLNGVEESCGNVEQFEDAGVSMEVLMVEEDEMMEVTQVFFEPGKTRKESKAVEEANRDEMMEVTEVFFEPGKTRKESKAVEEANIMNSEGNFETTCVAQGFIGLDEINQQTAVTVDTLVIAKNDGSFDETDANFEYRQYQVGEYKDSSDQERHVKEVTCELGENKDYEAGTNTENDSISSQEEIWPGNGLGSRTLSDLEKHAEEVAYELRGNDQEMEEFEVASNGEEDDSSLGSSNAERWVENGIDMGAKQQHCMPQVNGNMTEISPKQIKGELTDKKEVNHLETLTMKEIEAEDTLHNDFGVEKKNRREKEEAKQKELEKEKERIAVERAIQEVRERAFAEAQERAERAALERAAAEAQKRAMSKAWEKSSVEPNDMLPSEKASMEAKLKAERAAVERATAEARERALEKALAEKAALKERKQAEKSAAGKFSGAAGDNGAKSRDQHSKVQGPSSCSTHPISSNHGGPLATERFDGDNGESTVRCKATLERLQRTAERAAKALAEKNMRDLLAQKEQAERNRLAETLDAEVKRWSSGKERNLRALLSTLQYILGPNSGWRPIPLTDLISSASVKKAYRKATLVVHPDKLQQRGASIQQKYTCEKVFDLLKEAWNKFNAEER